MSGAWGSPSTSVSESVNRDAEDDTAEIENNEMMEEMLI